MVSDAASPLHFPRFGRWLIRAPGYAWNEYMFHEPKPEDTLALHAACRLTIDVTGLDPKGPAKLRVQPAHGGVEILTLDPSGGGHVELDSLPPGDFVVRAFLDFNQKPWFWHTVTLGSATVTLDPQVPAHAQFAVGAPPEGLHEDGTVDRHGFVTIPDGAGRRRFSGNAAFEFRYWRLSSDSSASLLFEMTEQGYDMERRYTAEIIDGEFSLRVPYGCHLDIEELELDGNTYQLALDEHRFDTTPEPFEIAIPAAASPFLTESAIMLHVIASDTSAELAGVEVITGSGWPGSAADHPGAVSADQVLLEAGASPFPLPRPRRFRGITSFWARAPGYAWSHFAADPDSEGELTVSLVPSCEILVQLVPPTKIGGALLRVRQPLDLDAMIKERRAELGALKPEDLPPGSPPPEEIRREFEEVLARLQSGNIAEQMAAMPLSVLLEVPSDSGRETVLESLPRGELLVSLERGELLNLPQVFGAAFVDASAGGRTVVSLSITPPQPDPGPVPLSGTILVPKEWGEPRATLCIRPGTQLFRAYQDRIEFELGQFQRVEGRPEVYAWDAGLVLPGEYMFSVEELGFGCRFSVENAGTRMQHIKIPPPAEVKVRFVDSRSGMPADVGSIWWFQADSPYESLCLEGVDEATGAFRFRAPIGRVELETSGFFTFDTFSQVVEIQPGVNEFTFPIVRSSGVRIVLKDGEATIPWRWEHGVRLLQIGGSGRDWAGGGMGDSAAHCLTVTNPGRYRVTFREVPGYRPVAPFEVEIPAGEMVDLVIPLVADR